MGFRRKVNLNSGYMKRYRAKLLKALYKEKKKLAKTNREREEQRKRIEYLDKAVKKTI